MLIAEIAISVFSHQQQALRTSYQTIGLPSSGVIVSRLGKLARPSGLLTLNQNNDFQKLKMTDVGIDRNTISRFYAHVERVNRLRTIPMRLWKHPRMRAASTKSSHLERVDSTPVSTSHVHPEGARCQFLSTHSRIERSGC